MAVTLLAVIVALAIGHLAPAIAAGLRQFSWFRSWLQWLNAQFPEGSFWRGPYGIALALVVVWGVAAGQWLTAPPPERAELLWGQTWRSCAFSITLIALPVLVAALGALREMAPTRLRLAGAAAGALAGGAGAAVYALHCPELGAPFVAVWYVLGMALPVALGAWLGPRVLRW